MALGGSSLGSESLGGESLEVVRDPNATSSVPDKRLDNPQSFYGDRKPVGKMKIDWSHPLTESLRHFWFMGEGNIPVDLARGGYELNYQTNEHPNIETATGRMKHFVRELNGLGGEGTFRFGSAGTNLTYMTSYQDTAGGTGAITGTSYNENRLTINTARSLSYKSNNSSGSVYGHTLVPVGEPVLIASGFDSSEIFSFINGGRNAVATTEVPNDQRFNVGARNNGDSYMLKADMAYFGYFDRALTVEELKSLELNPYQFLIPDRG